MSVSDWQDMIVVIVPMACAGYAIWWAATWGRR
jgi:hypothetical protein